MTILRRTDTDILVVYHNLLVLFVCLDFIGYSKSVEGPVRGEYAMLDIRRKAEARGARAHARVHDHRKISISSCTMKMMLKKVLKPQRFLCHDLKGHDKYELINKLIIRKY